METTGKKPPKYKRVLLKLSGEALAGDQKTGLNFDIIRSVCTVLKKCLAEGVQIGIVVGGGNFWRGRQGTNMDRSTADHMGMLATAINALALQDALEQKGVPTRVQTALTITRVAEPYILRKALRHLEKGRVVIFGCGTGNPYFSTDTTAALRAAEIHAEILLCAKNIDGIYDFDPKLVPNAKKYDRISYMEVIKQELKALDTTAISMCKENKIPILVFDGRKPCGIVNAVEGRDVGTVIE